MSQLHELLTIFLIKVVDNFYFTEYFRPLKFIDLVCEIIRSSICLECKLKFSDYSFIDNNFKDDIGDGNLKAESVLNLYDSESVLVEFNKLFDVDNCLDNIFNAEEDAFASNHIKQIEGDTFLTL